MRYKLNIPSKELINTFVDVSRIYSKFLAPEIYKKAKESGPKFIKKLSRNYRTRFEAVDKQASAVTDLEFVEFYSSKCFSFRDILKKIEEAAVVADSDMQSAAIDLGMYGPSMEGYLKAFETILLQAEPITISKRKRCRREE